MRATPLAMDEDPFLRRYQLSELKIASEFLTTWLPFLSRDLCRGCKQILSDRIRSLDQVPAVDGNGKPANVEADAASSTQNNMVSGETGINVDYDFDGRSTGSSEDVGNCDTHSLGSWKDGGDNLSESVSRRVLPSESPITEIESPRMSWADMAQEDQLGDEEELREKESDRQVIHVSSTGDLRVTKTVEKPKLSREQREYFRFMNVKRKKDFICLERFKGKIVNIVEGLELHTGVFSAVEQKRIVDFVYEQQAKGRKQELKERTYSAPNKWMRGKGRVTLQFGCCYNYATDKAGNPPGILQHETVDPIPHLFKVIIRRLVRWHVLPPTCVPDSCIVNVYEEGDCISPHIDNHDFLRPFCTVSFLSECSILFGSNLKIVGPGEFSGSYAIPLPMGSVLVLKGNGADVAKHCVPAVPKKRISITFRKMDESKRPVGFIPEPDLQGIQPLPYETNETSSSNSSGLNRNGDWGILPLPYETNRTSSTNLSGFSHNGNRRQPRQREGKAEVRDHYPERSNSRYEPRGSSGQRRMPGPQNRRRTKVDLEP